MKKNFVSINKVINKSILSLVFVAAMAMPVSKAQATLLVTGNLAFSVLVGFVGTYFSDCIFTCGETFVVLFLLDSQEAQFQVNPIVDSRLASQLNLSSEEVENYNRSTEEVELVVSKSLGLVKPGDGAGEFSKILRQQGEVVQQSLVVETFLKLAEYSRTQNQK